jgi:phenylalanyl-tRNA synthetase beta chain
MKAPFNWLNEYVDLKDISPKTFADEMTMSGSKVETLDLAGEDIKNVVVGRVLSISPHPDADRLLVCELDVGEAEPLQIVTGAQNLTPNDLVPVALHGAHLFGDVVIKKTKMRGVASFGMLCSYQELGLTIHDVPYAHPNGVLVLQEEYTPGTDIRKVFGLDDWVVEFEITSNRPDCLSMVGLAREAAATFKRTMHLPDTSVSNVDNSEAASSYLSVSVEAPDLCPRYMARVIKDVKIEPSPSWMRDYLRNAGVRPINNIVDITNYVMLEFGQPLHAFDYRYLNGKRIVVRRAENMETITTLDGIHRILDNDTLVICDEKSPVAVAGVMGGEFSGITDDTKIVVFESANFFGPSVRSTAKKLGLRTEASGRFEKGLDPAISPLAVERACHLVEQLGAGKVVSGVIDVDNSVKNTPSIPLRPDSINRFLGTSLSRQEMAEILISLDFTIDEKDQIIPPSFRSDVEGEADIAEEIARIYGYGNIPTTLFKGETTQGRYSDTQKAEQKIHEVLKAQGMSEIITYSFISPKYYDNICLASDSPLRTSVTISNPLGEDTSVMRTTTLPSFLEILSRNYNYRNPSASLYEIGKVYLPSEDISALPTEKKVITFGFYNAGDFFNLKGACERMFLALGLNHWEVSPQAEDPSFHPGRCAQITVGGTPLATLGQVHPSVLKNYGLTSATYVAMVDFEVLFTHLHSEKTYRPLPKFPAISRDLALICDDSVLAADIERCIKEAGGKLLENVSLFDVYKGKQIPEDKKSVAYSLTLRDPEKTMTDKAADLIVDKIIKSLEKSLNITLRL